MSKNRLSLLLAVLVISAMLLAACGSADNQDMPNAVSNTANNSNTTADDAGEAQMVPSVSATDQEIVGSTVTISEVVSNGPGWLVVHAQADGKPGPILGYSPVSDGDNQNVVVDLNLENATGTMYAMLHTDAGEVGTFEFPNGDDGPVSVDGSVVTPAFAVSGLPMPVPAAAVNLRDDPNLGSFLVDKIGMSLYIFLNDVPGTSNCYGGCEASWPPLFTGDAPVAGEGVDASLLGTTTRDDGSVQVTYNGWPLYYFASDANAGDVNGQDVGGVWYVIASDGEIIK